MVIVGARARFLMGGMAALSLVLSMRLAVARGTLLDEKPATPSLKPAEAQRYAQQIIQIIEQVRERYLRPVGRAELAVAALHGLYSAAHVPVPLDLSTQVQQNADNPMALHSLLVRLRQSLGNPEALRGQHDFLLSLQNLTEALDPFSVLLTGPELERNDGLTAQPRSLGLELVPTAALPLVVKTVVPGGPAQKAGLRPGDHLTELDGQPLTGSFTNAARRLQEKMAQLTVYRPSTQASWKVTLGPQEFHADTVLGEIRNADNSWDYFIDHEQHIAHVRIGALEVGTAAALAQVLADLSQAGMRGLLLDLRWSPGGSLPEAQAIADLFIAGYVQPHLVLPLPGNVVGLVNLAFNSFPRSAKVVYRERGIEEHYPPMDPGFFDFPMVVLINAETSGGAELIAAVLQDNLRARIAGQRSRGKASVQMILNLQRDLDLKGLYPPGSLKLSMGMLVRPNGRNLHRFSDSKTKDDWGVRPDPRLDFRVSGDLSRQLQEWWQLQDLRPGTSNESLPLDDPVADPQRQAALQVLRDLLTRSRK